MQKVLYFAKDPQVSSRILAILYEGTFKKTVPSKEKKVEQKVLEIKKFQVICSSNGRVGTRYSTISRVPTVGRKLTDKEFLEMYPKQCNIFKKMFVKEYENLKSK